jgi:hypothetical protein
VVIRGAAGALLAALKFNLRVMLALTEVLTI